MELIVCEAERREGKEEDEEVEEEVEEEVRQMVAGISFR